MRDLDSIIEKHGLRKTAFRRSLLSLFYTADNSLTIEKIRSTINQKADKVTVYRSLEAFEKSGLIHKVPDKDNLTRYALCTGCEIDEHVHNHAHLICESCGDTFCINDFEVPVVGNLKGFKVKTQRLILEGECDKCQE